MKFSLSLILVFLFSQCYSQKSIIVNYSYYNLGLLTFVSAEMTPDSSQFVGKYIEFSDKDRKCKLLEGQYSNMQKTGSWISYLQGNKVSVIESYKGDVLDGYLDYYVDSKIRCRLFYQESRIIYVDLFNSVNGSFDRIYVKDTLNIALTSDKKILSDSIIIKRNILFLQKKYDKAGCLIQYVKYNFDDGKIIEKTNIDKNSWSEVKVHSDGSCQVTYFKGGVRKHSYDYDSLGKRIRYTLYKNNYEVLFSSTKNL